MPKDYVTAEQSLELSARINRALQLSQHGGRRVQGWIEDPNLEANLQAWLQNNMRLEVVGGITIDRDRPLVLSEGWEIRDENQILTRATGTFVSGSGSTIRTYLDKRQVTDECRLNGTDIHAILWMKNLAVERATTLEQYAANPASVPQEMRDGRFYIAWGDIVQSDDNYPHVLIFWWRDGQPQTSWHHIDSNSFIFDAKSPALLAS